MPANTLDIEFKKYYSLLNNTQKKSVVEMLKSFVQSESKTSFTMEDYNADIDKAMEEYRKGEVLPHEGVMKLSKKW